MASVRIAPVDPRDPEALWCLGQYYAEFAERFEGGFQAERSLVSDPTVFQPPHGVFLLGRLDARPGKG